MKRKFHHRVHKWLGIPVCVLMFLFCLSGIVLNHRQFFANTGVSRSLLPQRYHYTNWNNGLLRGTLPLPDGSVLLYGSSGIFLYSDSSFFILHSSFNQDFRRMVALPDSQIVGVTPFNVHFLRHNPNSNSSLLTSSTPLPLEDSSLFTLHSSLNFGERLSDVVTHGDSLIVVGRSHLFLSTAPNYNKFQKITLPPPLSTAEYPRQTLFRTVWQLHSGELFGLPGRLVVDIIALILIFLSLTGLLLLIRPRNFDFVDPATARKSKQARLSSLNRGVQLSTFNFQLSTIKWHNAVGRYTIILTLFVVVTGVFLRPPLMIPLVLTKHPVNSWHDKLRMLRYDDTTQQWLLHTSAGFYSYSGNVSNSSLFTIHSSFPKVGMMGLSVWEKGTDGEWIFGEAPYVSGYSADLGAPFFVYYGEGTDRLPQPSELEGLEMSLWNLCLELHTGRLLFGFVADYFYVFLSGILTIWVLVAGWKLRSKGVKKDRTNHKKKKNNID